MGDSKVIKPEILKSVSDLVKPPRLAYYMEAVSGGYQLHRLTIEDDVVLSDERVEDPDGWPEVVGYLETEFSKEHFSK